MGILHAIDCLSLAAPTRVMYTYRVSVKEISVYNESNRFLCLGNRQIFFVQLLKKRIFFNLKNVYIIIIECSFKKIMHIHN